MRHAMLLSTYSTGSPDDATDAMLHHDQRLFWDLVSRSHTMWHK